MAATDEMISASIRTFCETLHAHYVRLPMQDGSEPMQTMRPQRYIFPTSTLATGVWLPGDDVHLVCITEDRKQIFWSIVAETLGLEGQETKEFSPGVMKLAWSALGVEKAPRNSAVYLHYALLPPDLAINDFARKDAVPNLLEIIRYPTSDRKTPYMRKHIELARRAVHITSTTQPKGSQFQTAYHQLHTWARSTGLLSQALELLNGDTLLELLFRTCEPCMAVENPRFLQTFFRDASTYLEAAGVRPHSISAFLQVLGHCDRIIVRHGGYESEGGVAALDLEHITIARGLDLFLDSYEDFLVLDLETWAKNPQDRMHFQSEGFLEVIKRLCTGAFSEIENGCGASTIPYRAWPYLVGEEGSKLCILGVCDGRSLTTDEVDAVQTWLASCCEDKEGRIDAKSITKERARALFAAGLERNDSPTAPIRSAQESASSSYLRPFSQIQSRLRWDPAHMSTPYEVGYEDRFDKSNLIWRNLEQWAKATEDEDFVPESRVRTVRRVEDKHVVWDREKRVDRTAGV
ncbi:hypothetical protein LTR56_014902 [Elasticomyces elasticus]|nr:hypothetical protein LTR56_014902 [Elasticomyces elasticus]KAK3653265.1 hypothetical protein LTR22_011225 [Elasticomyces elasticus]KAK4918290.1 hypothetical protein LTR49_013989 [Elasticomyces elasticus]KAK5758324.1 hypothetical protein LTS12_011497 [Elasticomyces elasticus]